MGRPKQPDTREDNGNNDDNIADVPGRCNWTGCPLCPRPLAPSMTATLWWDSILRVTERLERQARLTTTNAPILGADQPYTRRQRLITLRRDRESLDLPRPGARDRHRTGAGTCRARGLCGSEEVPEWTGHSYATENNDMACLAATLHHHGRPLSSFAQAWHQKGEWPDAKMVPPRV
jgi:hypothetical protein